MTKASLTLRQTICSTPLLLDVLVVLEEGRQVTVGAAGSELTVSPATAAQSSGVSQETAAGWRRASVGQCY